ncbi:MAG: MBL fold metallo-hydrolase [Nevskiaceae bacterium]
MSTRSRVLLAVLALGLLVYGQRATLAVWLAERGLTRIAANEDPLAALEDGLHVGLCGAGSPFPDPERSGPCTVVIAGRDMFVVDAGGGSAVQLARMQLNAGQLKAVLLTHYHSDHIGGLGDLLLQRWIGAHAAEPLPVYGPQGLPQVLEGIEAAYRLDAGYRTAHHGEAVAPPSGFGTTPRPFDISTEQRRVLIESPTLQVVAFRVDHGPVSPAVGYRFRYKDRQLVISGDTRRSAAVQREAQGVDLLVHEALSPQLVRMMEHSFVNAQRPQLAQIMTDIRNYHASPVEAAQVAAAAEVRMLVFNHIVPPLPVPGLETKFLEGTADAFPGPIQVGRDGDWFSLPAGSRRIDQSRRP